MKLISDITKKFYASDRRHYEWLMKLKEERPFLFNSIDTLRIGFALFSGGGAVILTIINYNQYSSGGAWWLPPLMIAGGCYWLFILLTVPWQWSGFRDTSTWKKRIFW